MSFTETLAAYVANSDFAAIPQDVRTEAKRATRSATVVTKLECSTSWGARSRSSTSSPVSASIPLARGPNPSTAVVAGSLPGGTGVIGATGLPEQSGTAGAMVNRSNPDSYINPAARAGELPLTALDLS